MTPLVALGVGLLGGLGAVARYTLGVAGAHRTHLPLGTLLVNLSGAFALGLLAGTGAGTTTMRLLGGGLLGAYTTFSTWMLNTHDLAAAGHRGAAVANVAGSLVAGLALAWLGRELGRAL